MHRIKAVYRDGVFLPALPCDFPENAEVELQVYSASAQEPVVNAFDDKQRILQEVTSRMQRNPLPPNTPHYTREELHDRR